jgi:transposase
MDSENRPWMRRRWNVIFQALVDPRIAAMIAVHVGLAVATVHWIVATYNRLGPSAICTPGKGGRRRQYLTIDEEKAFLAPCFEDAAKGKFVTVREIKRAYEDKVGHEVDEATIYRLLNRHGWRKVAPRPCHPDSDPEEQETWAKEFPDKVEEIVQARDPEDTRPILLMASEPHFWSNKSTKEGMGSSSRTTSRTEADRSRICLCICSSSSRNWRHNRPCPNVK